MIDPAAGAVVEGEAGALIHDQLGAAIRRRRRGAAPGGAGDHRGPEMIDRHTRAALR